MLPRRRRTAAVAMAMAIALAVPARVLAEPVVEPPPADVPVPRPWRFGGSPTCTSSGVTLELPPGYYLANSAWEKLDLELHRLQGTETRLAAENEVFRRHAAAGNLGWRGAALIAGVAFTAGAAATYYALR